jgi:hypothetical protein
VPITRSTVLQNTTFVGVLWFAIMFWAQVLRKLETHNCCRKVLPVVTNPISSNFLYMEMEYSLKVLMRVVCCRKELHVTQNLALSYKKLF